jgi:hypothetical protein
MHKQFDLTYLWLLWYRYHTQPNLTLTLKSQQNGWTGRLITLPLLLTLDHDWSLYFACDRGSQIVCLCFLSPDQSR